MQVPYIEPTYDMPAVISELNMETYFLYNIEGEITQCPFTANVYKDKCYDGNVDIAGLIMSSYDGYDSFTAEGLPENWEIYVTNEMAPSGISVHIRLTTPSRDAVESFNGTIVIKYLGTPLFKVTF